MALPIGSAFRSAGRFAFRNPMTLLKMARHALGMRLAIPLDSVRWFMANMGQGKGPTDVTILAKPPGVALGASVDLMGTPIRANATVFVDEIRVRDDEVGVSMRLKDVDLNLLGNALTPVAALLKSGALDLSKPGNLVNFMPAKPPVLIDAHDDVIVLDLMKDKKFASNSTVRKVLATLAPVLQVTSLNTDGDFLVVALRAMPSGIPKALESARQ